MKARTILPAVLLLGSVTAASGQDAPMSFFLTSVNPGQGANLGGLEGADAYCTSLAEAVGVTGQTWRAYLSTSAVDARDRIGDGPWYNVSGVLVAAPATPHSGALRGPATRHTLRTAARRPAAPLHHRGC